MDSAPVSAEDKLRLIQERIAEKAKAKAQKQDEDALERQISEAEKLEELVDKYGVPGRDFRVLHAPDGHMIAVKKPTYLQWKKFQSDGIEKVKAQEDIVESCLIHPAKGVFHELRERFPALVFQATIEIGNMASVQQAELPGK